MLDAIHVLVESIEVDGENNTAITLRVGEDSMPTLEPTTVRFIQTQEATEMGIAILPYGGVIFGGNVTGVDAFVELKADIKGVEYTAETRLTPAAEIGDVFTLNKESSGGSGGDIPITPPG